MKHIAEPLSFMPDVAIERRQGGPLAWVGMEGIAVPVQIDTGHGVSQQVIASVDALVNLVRVDQRGIHMSRLYRLVDEQLGTTTLDADALERLLQAFLHSQQGLAGRARVRLRFDHPVRRKALRSGLHGWRVYPVAIEATLDGDDLSIAMTTEVVYSSTCPASAALARQLIQERFAQTFPAPMPVPHDDVFHWLGSEQGIVATPHAQRSVARVWTLLDTGAAWNTVALIDRIEAALGTPVQAMVKREDEQAFALANGSNLMFCEDAARRIQRALDEAPGVADFHVRVEHQESLHAHNAVAEATKAG